MGLLKEFRQFAMRGNVVDLAVGIVIGAAFGKIVSSLVSDVMMPPIGYLIGGKMFADIKIHLGGEAALNLGTFLEAVFDFIIIAFSVFLLVKGINKLKKKEEIAPASPPAPSPEEKLLTEIRDILKERNS